jgi:hypothetical protein
MRSALLYFSVFVSYFDVLLFVGLGGVSWAVVSSLWKNVRRFASMSLARPSRSKKEDSIHISPPFPPSPWPLPHAADLAPVLICIPACSQSFRQAGSASRSPWASPPTWLPRSAPHPRALSASPSLIPPDTGARCTALPRPTSGVSVALCPPLWPGPLPHASRRSDLPLQRCNPDCFPTSVCMNCIFSS